MKLYLKYVLLTFGVLHFVSCDDNLNVVNENGLASETVFNTLGSIEGAVVGVYSLNQSGDLNGMPQLMSDFMSDNVRFAGSFTSLQDIDQFETLATNTSIDNIWLDGYQLINAANNIINNLPETTATDISEGQISEFIGEAKFLRALTYFQLVNLFAQPFQFNGGSNLGVPIQTEDFQGDITPFQLERSSVNEVHAFIEQDLLDAIAALPDDRATRGRATATAARALLSRLHLYREQWESAANFADQVISAGDFTLATDLDFYDDNPTSPENIFVSINLPADGPQEVAGSDEVYTNFYNPAPGARGDAPFSDDLLADFGFAVGDTITGDLRFDNLSQAATDAQGIATFFTTKYEDKVNNDSDGMILRVAEMYLNRAEANFRNGSAIGDTPLNDVNAVRARAGLPALGSVDLDAILTERRKEFCFEGHRRMDLLRNNLNLRPGGGAASAPGADKVIFPIVDDELNNNPNITQNPGSF
nr:RagB/SusD family nutrient uptake outer membrane protein [uncultured Allomuricauda sp.]